MNPTQLGPYRVTKLLGRGGMGAVYAAINELDQSTAAVKVLSGALADDQQFRERFALEIETLKHLRHPNIVAMYGHGQQDGLMFYAMELVDGRSLQDELAGGRWFKWREVCQLGLQMCAALRHAHDRGVIHRDLKPANLLVDGRGALKLTDFGIARLFGASGLTVEGGVVGTADYMSPEQAEGQPVSARSDLYSLGAVFFALLSRRAPFASNSIVQVIHKLKTETPEPVSRFAPDVPKELEEIIAKLLEKDPLKRIGAAQAVAKRLQAVLDESAPPAAAAAPPPPAAPANQPGGHGAPTISSSPGGPFHATSSGSSQSGFDLRPTSLGPPATKQRDEPAPPAGAEISLASNAPASAADVTQAHTRPAKTAQPAAVAAEAPAPKITHFTTVDEERRRAALAKTDAPEAGPPLWLKIAAPAAMLLVILAVVAYVAWPPSPDALYGVIRAAADKGSPAELRSVESELQRFLTRHADDPRADEVRAWQEELQTHRLQRSLELNARKLGASPVSSPLERLYLDAMRVADTQPELAIAKLQAMLDLMDPDEGASRADKQCLTLAKQDLTRLRQVVEQTSRRHLELLRDRLDRAEKQLAADPRAAAAACRAVTLLYGDKAWARPAVARAEEMLTRAAARLEPADDAP